MIDLMNKNTNKMKEEYHISNFQHNSNASGFVNSVSKDESSSGICAYLMLLFKSR